MKSPVKEPVVTLGHYSTRPSGDGFEVLADDEVVAWTMEGRWAIYLLALLVEADQEHKHHANPAFRPPGWNSKHG